MFRFRVDFENGNCSSTGGESFKRDGGTNFGRSFGGRSMEESFAVRERSRDTEGYSSRNTDVSTPSNRVLFVSLILVSDSLLCSTTISYRRRNLTTRI